MKIQILDKTGKRKFISGLAEFGLGKIPGLLVRTGTERIRAFSGSLTREEIMEIWRMFPIEGVGLYVGKIVSRRKGVGGREVRLSVDGIQMLSASGVRGSGLGVLGRIIILTKEQEERWFLGEDINLKNCNVDSGFVLVKSADGKDFVGMGKVGGEGKILFGYLPKERRRRISVV